MNRNLISIRYKLHEKTLLRVWAAFSYIEFQCVGALQFYSLFGARSFSKQFNSFALAFQFICEMRFFRIWESLLFFCFAPDFFFLFGCVPDECYYSVFCVALFLLCSYVAAHSSHSQVRFTCLYWCRGDRNLQCGMKEDDGRRHNTTDFECEYLMRNDTMWSTFCVVVRVALCFPCFLCCVLSFYDGRVCVLIGVECTQAELATPGYRYICKIGCSAPSHKMQQMSQRTEKKTSTNSTIYR